MSVTIEELIVKYKRPILVDENGCWNWMGSISSQGYGIFNNKLVHGIVFRMAGGKCDLDKVLCHKCNNKRCINPNHLYEGTYTQNLIDAVLDGRSKLGRDGFRKAFELSEAGMKQADIARELNVSRQLIWCFLHGKMMTYKPEDFSNAKSSEPPKQ